MRPPKREEGLVGDAGCGEKDTMELPRPMEAAREGSTGRRRGERTDGNVANVCVVDGATAGGSVDVRIFGGGGLRVAF